MKKYFIICEGEGIFATPEYPEQREKIVLFPFAAETSIFNCIELFVENVSKQLEKFEIFFCESEISEELLKTLDKKEYFQDTFLHFLPYEKLSDISVNKLYLIAKDKEIIPYSAKIFTSNYLEFRQYAESRKWKEDVVFRVNSDNFDNVKQEFLDASEKFPDWFYKKENLGKHLIDESENNKDEGILLGFDIVYDSWCSDYFYYVEGNHWISTFHRVKFQ